MVLNISLTMCFYQEKVLDFRAVTFTSSNCHYCYGLVSTMMKVSYISYSSGVQSTLIFQELNNSQLRYFSYAIRNANIQLNLHLDWDSCLFSVWDRSKSCQNKSMIANNTTAKEYYPMQVLITISMLLEFAYRR